MPHTTDSAEHFSGGPVVPPRVHSWLASAVGDKRQERPLFPGKRTLRAA